MKPRILLYAHDGSGFGHLMRISRLASRLQGRCTCLILTGTREAAWFVDPSCEFMKLPSWASMFRRQAGANTGKLWHEMPKEDIVRFRSQLIESISTVFAPDAIIVDYLPFGLRNELLDTLRKTPARKYLIMRSVIDSSDTELRSILSSTEFAELYDRVLVAADKRLTDALNDFPLCAAARAKCEWIGYITNSCSSRKAKGCTHDSHSKSIQVVCSAGSGLRGESLFSECIDAAPRHPLATFEVVVGARSSFVAASSDELLKNIRLSTFRTDLPELHANADVVVTSGGYNSILEAMIGGAEIVVSPVNEGLKDEQLRHAQQLQRYYPIAIATSPSELPRLLSQAIHNASTGRVLQFPLAIDGIERAADIICGELSTMRGER